MSQFYDDDNADSILKEITENLSKQVSEELDYNDKAKSEKMNNNKQTGKKKPKKYKKILLAIASVLAVLVVVIFFVGKGVLDQINRENSEDVVIKEDDTLDTSTIVDTTDIVPPDTSVINVLLIGEEKMHDTTRGRSDSMMIATINQTQKTVKLTSVMRDCYVDIPDHGKGKLNSAYNIGGGPLLVQTIEQNFKIAIDGYVRVDFDAFEEIVNELGGVEIELTANEASYLNRKDYISKPEFRNVTEGLHLLNGNQALGYARVRYITGIDGEHDDFGRTNRQRTVLNAIFEKYKTKNLIELVSIANSLLKHITTDLSNTKILSYVAAYVGTGTTELETFRIPMNNGYSTTKNQAGSVLLVNFEKNNAALQEFIYGVSTDNGTTTDSTNTNTALTQ
ncbi:MAG: LCP family protein [Velocimicrobium sp.]